jgi:aminobenzoyl-glutamate utilization protein B
VWYFLRETDYLHIKELREIADRMAQGAALMTDTTVKSRVLGAAWPQHFNKTVAEVMYNNIKTVGLPVWDEADQTLAKAIQKELGQPQTGLNTKIDPFAGGAKPEDNIGGGSDDIGDVSWNVPTVTLRYPSNMPGLPGHNWANAIASATPIAHKGATAGAKVIAMTTLDFLTKPELVTQAWDYFRNVQTKDRKYEPLLGPDDRPDTSLNVKTMERYRAEMRKYYYDPSKYATYLEQLGITYPTVRSK